MSLRPSPPLPLELGGISDDRREQLESRRQREMTRQQEQSDSRLGAGEFRWSPIAMIPAHLCVLIFLIFLLEKLEGSLDWPWAAVLSPLWITDAVFIVVKVSLRASGRTPCSSCVCCLREHMGRWMTLCVPSVRVAGGDEFQLETSC